MSRFLTLALLTACATTPTAHTLDDGRRVTYDSQPLQCFRRCDSTRLGESCEYVCEPQLSVQVVEPSCRTQCASSELQADCIRRCEQPPFVCGNAPRPPSRTTNLVGTVLGVIGASVVALIAADQALGR